jgi:hypothetical protein
MRILIFLATLLVAMPQTRPATAESSPGTTHPVFYAIERNVTVYRSEEGTQPYIRLAFREAVFMLDEGMPFSRVRTVSGAEGYVRTGQLSNHWIRVSKSEKTLYFYRGTDLVRAIPIDLGYNTFSDKERRGSDLDPDHWRTPEGTFFVAQLNPNSQFYKGFVLNYPATRDAERGLRQGLITTAQYDAIVQAEQTFSMPPMHTLLGGWIMIHGHGTGGRANWTQGCVAVRDEEMDFLWRYVRIGTPVTIEP